MFKRGQVSKIVEGMGLDVAALEGSARAEGYFIDFETFVTVRDPLDYFAKAMETELEHGRAAAAVGANVTDDDPMQTAQIVLSHLCGIEFGRENPRSVKMCPKFPQYYDFLWWMERTHESWTKQRLHK